MNVNRLSIILTIILISTFSAIAQSKYAPSKTGASFDGYDLVSYFQESGPIQGKVEFESKYDGLTLYFKNFNNKRDFESDPERYLPAYGGYCATAVSSKKLISPNYKIYTFQNNRLLFFEVKGFFNGKTHWEKNPGKNELKADRYYNEKFIAKEF